MANLKNQFEETFDVCLQAKNRFHPSHFPEILQGYCKLVIVDTLGMTGYVHLK